MLVYVIIKEGGMRHFLPMCEHRGIRDAIAMSRELPFMVLCAEEYKNQKGLTGKEVTDLFKKYSVFEYIKNFYEVLHTAGTKYIVDDIDLYIKSRKIS